MSAMEDTARLLRRLLDEDRESAWLEFKTNLADPQQIGEYVSALANGAALEGRSHGYLVWGVDDASHDVVGTSVDLSALKKGNEDLEPWWLRLLTPQVPLRFLRVGETRPVWLMEVGAATTNPVAFEGIEYVRVASYKKKLKSHAELERRLWRGFEREVFEMSAAMDRLGEDEVLDLLDYPGYFRLVGTPLPENRAGILDHLQQAGLVARASVGWTITNLGAALFARDLVDFPTVTRKTVRVIQYQGNGRVETVREREFKGGYAVTFEAVIDFVSTLLPRKEIIGRALREEHTRYPEIVLRELIANMLIHQDFTETGTGPMVEIFDNRVEITNPGTPVIDVRRFLDLPAKSRNEKIARMMRLCHLAEERGTGWDKIAAAVELHGLPAPRVEVTNSHTRTAIFGPKDLAAMDRDERIRSVYLHACLRYVQDEPTTNASVRERFGIEDINKAQVSRALKEAADSGTIVIYDSTVGYRSRRYVPFWAVESSRSPID